MPTRFRPDAPLVSDASRYRLTAEELAFRPVAAPAVGALPMLFVQGDLPLGRGYWSRLRSAQRRTPGGTACRRQGAGAGGLPPTSNTGGKVQTVAGVDADQKRGDREAYYLICDDGKVKEYIPRKAWGGGLAHVDQVSFTVHEDTCRKFAGHGCVADVDYVAAMSAKLVEIFGFGVKAQRDKGMNFYCSTWLLGDGYGHLSFGGQRETMLVQLTATGCAAALEGWELRLYEFLHDVAVQPRLTRIDCAYDDFFGEYSVDQAYADAQAGLFQSGGRPPFVEKRSDWDNPDGSGRTLYVGKRKNGKFCRIYEKGKEQGSKASPWVRVEVEFKSVDRVIPFDVLLDAGAYLAASYPAFERFKGKSTPKRIETQTKSAVHAVEHYLHYGQLQVGRLVNYLREVAGWDTQTVLDKLARPGEGYPKRLKLSALSCDFDDPDYLHTRPRLSADPYNMIAYPANLAAGANKAYPRAELRN